MSILQVDNLSGLSGTDITIEIGKAITGAASQFKITGGTAGQVIQTDGSGGLSFTTAGGLPAQASQSGKFLTTDGSAASWATVDALPSQTGQAGEFLQTDGTTATWEAVDALPSQTGQAGEYLKTDGTTATWEPVTSGTTIPAQSTHSGKYLTTDGTNLSWATVDAFPTQTGNDGKFLTTDGTYPSWAVVDALPSQTGNSGKYLVTDGTDATWETLALSGAAYDTETTSTGYLDIPVGTTAQRPGTVDGGGLTITAPSVGALRFNSELESLEVYCGEQPVLGGNEPIWSGFGGSTPATASISPATSPVAGTSIALTGANYQNGAIVRILGNDGTVYVPPTITWVNTGSIQITTPELPITNEPFDIKVTNPNGLFHVLVDILDAGSVPSWTTAAGNVGNIYDMATGTHATIVATDPDGGAVTYSVDSTSAATLASAGMTLNSDGTITGDSLTDVSAQTTYNFDVIATDTESNTSTRAFSITLNETPAFHGATGGIITTYVATHTGGGAGTNNEEMTPGTKMKAHTFLDYETAENFVVPLKGGKAELMLVGGGGGGGNYTTTNANGGGGAGAMLVVGRLDINLGYEIGIGTFPVNVGNGGYGSQHQQTTQMKSGESSWIDFQPSVSSAGFLCANGGGYGASTHTRQAAAGGCSGGTGYGVTSQPGSNQQGSVHSGGDNGAPTNSGAPHNVNIPGTATDNTKQWFGWGYPGGSSSHTWTGAGGGGAGGAGRNAGGSPGDPGDGDGGDGRKNHFRTGLDIYYAGGGGGGGNSSETSGDGYHGGGRGFGTCTHYGHTTYLNEVNASTQGSGTLHAIMGTGGGGGAATYWSNNEPAWHSNDFNTDGNGESLPHGIVNGSGHGGSGIVIIRYVDESV